LKKDFLLEIGSENLPSGYISQAIEQLRKGFEELFKANRIDFESIKTFSTPLRLVVLARGVSTKQSSTEEKVVGPPVKVGVDKNGNFTKAAIGFAKSQGVEVGSLKKIETERGKYLAVIKKKKGRKTEVVLAESIPDVIASVRFPKVMKWDGSGFRWPRPVRWVLAIFGSKVIKFRLGEIDADNKTCISIYRGIYKGVRSVEGYFEVLEKDGIIIDQDERKSIVSRKGKLAAKRSGGVLVEDEDLLETVTNMLERPVAIVGSYSEDFLKLPRDVIVTALKSHQKYFSVERKDGSGLLPRFVAFADGADRNLAGIRAGYERVLQARLDDAVFYFNEDTSYPIDEMAEKLRGIVWLEGLGTVFQKGIRLEKLGVKIFREWKGEDKSGENLIRRASRIAKADLASEMVKDGKEFTLLQGYIGREYAKISGENREICEAIYEHYLPRFSGDSLPHSITGTVLALADKLDTIAGCFVLGLEPTGSQDPYALRRNAMGVIRIMIEKEIPVSLKILLGESLKLVLKDVTEGKRSRNKEEILNSIMTFFQQRLNVSLRSDGADYDLVNSATSAPWENPLAVKRLVDELQKRRNAGNLEPLVLAIKRIGNILPKRVKESFSAKRGFLSLKGFVNRDEALLEVSSALFEEESERKFFLAMSEASRKLSNIMNDYLRFHEAIYIFETLIPNINEYFDRVLVNCDDEKLRKNRHNFLSRTNEVFSLFCDFSQISGERSAG